MQQTARISTAFTKAFKCKLPVILPPMVRLSLTVDKKMIEILFFKGGVAGPALAGAIASAGCIGFVGTGGIPVNVKTATTSLT
jgi:hypothetical protein